MGLRTAMFVDFGGVGYIWRHCVGGKGEQGGTRGGSQGGIGAADVGRPAAWCYVTARPLESRERVSGINEGVREAGGGFGVWRLVVVEGGGPAGAGCLPRGDKGRARHKCVTLLCESLGAWQDDGTGVREGVRLAVALLSVTSPPRRKGLPVTPACSNKNTAVALLLPATRGKNN
ncbi:hypothetical protein E2C01_057216 [Portunus trituberculatus]|uniref:Uncharacterized protein n=1 Tax=Portunus trituberculatus TaxID=210409 RepID=A0A5B7GW73_PORTR|nr:hypothetical protein [Portunus trituberculatus]